MGHLQPPNQNCFVLDIMEFLSFIHYSLILVELLRQKYQTAPQTEFLATLLY